jgi:LAS superfamily LD-carboxypeptidase LdcB
MKKFVILLIVAAMIIIGYRSYSYFERKSVIDSRTPKKTTVMEDIKGIIGIKKEQEKKEPEHTSQQIRVFIPEKKDSAAKTYTNEDIKKLDLKKFRTKKFITEKDIQKLKENSEDKKEEKKEVRHVQ